MSRPRLTYANVVATLALVFAITGGAYAATQLPKNSVGTRQLKKNAVTSSKVKDRSLVARDFKSGQLPAGPAGVPGQTGSAGAPGKDGANGATSVVVRTTVIHASSESGFRTYCNPGERAVGGGVSRANLSASGSDVVRATGPVAGTAASPVGANAGDVPTGWTGSFDTGGAVVDIVVYALCASP
jgi:hypothetical protein